MKSLFRDDCVYTDEALAIEDRIAPAVRAALREYVALGYSPREISHVMQNLISAMESEEVLNLRMRKY